MAFGDASQLMNGDSKIEPRTNTLIGEMIDAGTPHGGFNDGKDCLRKVSCVGRGTNLVKDYAQTFFLLTQTDHCLDEIIPE